jgi:hypothetical protein
LKPHKQNREARKIKKKVTGKKKRPKHVGNIEHYNFDREDFLKYCTSRHFQLGQKQVGEIYPSNTNS